MAQRVDEVLLETGFGEPSQRAYEAPFKRARRDAFARSNSVCQFCGLRAATSGHHWAVEYPPASDVTGDDLTALCDPCHTVATALRRFTQAGGDIFEFMSRFRKALKQ